jgi:hypothetical protein
MTVCFVSIDDSDTHRYTDAPMSFRVFGAGEVGGPPPQARSMAGSDPTHVVTTSANARQVWTSSATFQYHVDKHQERVYPA